MSEPTEPASPASQSESLNPAGENSRQIRIFDTTLRDGEQSPGASMNLAEKLEVAAALSEMGVDVIEAGFPIASPGDFESVRQIAATVRGSTICGLARCSDKDIDRAWEALKVAPSARIHVFLATSAIHRQFKLRMTTDEIVERAIAGVSRAASYCDDVEFSPEDACRTEHDFCAGSSKQPSTRVPPQLTCPTRSATPRPAKFLIALQC